jgi:hypothetical protein
MQFTSRRAFAKTLAAAGGSVLLSSLAKKTLADAAGVNAPRFIAFITPSGHPPEEWWPKTPPATPEAFTLGRILKPVEKFKNRLLLIDGLGIRYDIHQPGDEHQQGAGKLLTGANLLSGPYGGGAISPGWSTAQSLDQMLAAKFGTRSIYAGVQVTIQNTWSRYSYLGRDKPNTPIQDPAELYRMLFSDFKLPQAGGTVPTAPQKPRFGKASVDFLVQDLSRLKSKLAGAERARLDEHVDYLAKRADQLNKPLGGPPVGNASCALPKTSMSIPFMDNNLHGMVGRLQIDNIVAAARCGISRVGVLQWSQSISGTNFSWLLPGQTISHHSMTHSFGGTGGQKSDFLAPMAPELFIQASTWYAEQFAYLLEQLDSVPEGTGTMLDNTIVFWGTDLNGFGHQHARMPFVLAGGGAGKMRAGRYIRVPKFHNDLLTGISHAMGMPMDKIGEPDYCRGTIDLS